MYVCGCETGERRGEEKRREEKRREERGEERRVGGGERVMNKPIHHVLFAVTHTH